MNKPLQQFPTLSQIETDDKGTISTPLLEALRRDSSIAASSSRIRFFSGFPKHSSEDHKVGEIFNLAFTAGDERFVLPAVWKEPLEPVREAFFALQRWEGIVTERRERSFVARLTDLTTDGPVEEVDLSLEDVPSEDRNLVEPGAVFYWSVGYRDDASGQRWRASTLRFRRLPVWSESELEAAAERASEVAEVFGGG